MSLRIYQPSDLRRWLRGYKPGWFTNRTGGGGGGGLASVSHDSTLTGLGTAGTPLSVDHPPGWPNDFFQNTDVWHDQAISGANQVDVNGIVLPAAVRFSNISVHIGTADAVGFYDVGIYSVAGALLANIGPVHIAATGILTAAVNQGAVTLNPGRYIFAITGNAAVANFGYNNGTYAWRVSTNYAASAGGTLPNSVTAFTLVIGANPSNCILN